jgi:hypothetical protein
VQDSVKRGIRECLHQIHCTTDELSHSRRREEALRPGVQPTHLGEGIRHIWGGHLGNIWRHSGNIWRHSGNIWRHSGNIKVPIS